MKRKLLSLMLTLSLLTCFIFSLPVSAGALDYSQGQKIARAITDEGIVMLKNENGALPIRKGGKVALFGDAQRMGPKDNDGTWNMKGYIPYGYGSETQAGDFGGKEIDPYYRTTKIVYAHYKDNGDIVSDPFIREAGVGRYDANWDAIRGEWFFAASDGIVKKENAEGFEIRGIRSGSYLCFQNVNNMRQNALMHMRLANGNDAPCAVEIRENSPFGPVLGCVRAENTGGFDVFRTFDCRLDNTHGTHSLCFVFRSEAEEPARFEDFCFDKVRP